MNATGDADLELALRWSEAVNRSISEIVVEVPPFPLVRESLESMRGKADVMVVSATPGEALEREWSEHGLIEHVALLAGQELGSKKEHLTLAAGGRYEPEKILMVGDRSRDWEAARAAACSSFPINPGCEDESWQRFFEEGLPRFFAGDLCRASTWNPSSSGSSSCCRNGRRGNWADWRGEAAALVQRSAERARFLRCPRSAGGRNARRSGTIASQIAIRRNEIQ